MLMCANVSKLTRDNAHKNRHKDERGHFHTYAPAGTSGSCVLMR
jgi:hypothetical protein